MKNIAQVVKTACAAIAATALIPFGILTAQAATTGEQFAVVSGIECMLDLNGRSMNGMNNISSDEYTVAVKVPAGSQVFAHCQNGQGSVPLTNSASQVGVDFFANPTEVAPFHTVDRMPAAAPSQKVKESAPVTRSHKTYTSQQNTKVEGNDGKVAVSTTTSAHSAPAQAATPKDSEAAASVSDDMGTVRQDTVAEETPETDTVSADPTTSPTSDSVVEGQQIEASEYAAANLSMVDRMGGAGTLIGIIILGLIGAAGAISLARSIILG
ncbi:MAG: hypothetical protein Q4P66_03065 [Actinomycetaceae bacterium]|nr:hypothetical protein [Actinomycetaceae bacterium]